MTKTQSFRLDRDKVVEAEPSEPTDHGRTWLSPYALPRIITIQSSPDQGSLIAIAYQSDDEPPLASVALDQDRDVPVVVTCAAHTGKILTLTSPAFITPFDFPAIANRLAAAAEYVIRPAQRLSYRMVADCLRQLTLPATGLDPDPGRFVSEPPKLG